MADEQGRMSGAFEALEGMGDYHYGAWANEKEEQILWPHLDVGDTEERHYDWWRPSEDPLLHPGWRVFDGDIIEAKAPLESDNTAAWGVFDVGDVPRAHMADLWRRGDGFAPSVVANVDFFGGRCFTFAPPEVDIDALDRPRSPLRHGVAGSKRWFARFLHEVALAHSGVTIVGGDGTSTVGISRAKKEGLDIFDPFDFEMCWTTGLELTEVNALVHVTNGLWTHNVFVTKFPPDASEEDRREGINATEIARFCILVCQTAYDDEGNLFWTNDDTVASVADQITEWSVHE